MNNNDKGNGSLSPSEEIEELLRRYAVLNSETNNESKVETKPQQKPEPRYSNQTKQPNRNIDISFSLDDDLNSPSFKSAMRERKEEKVKDTANRPAKHRGEVYFSSHSNSNNIPLNTQPNSKKSKDVSQNEQNNVAKQSRTASKQSNRPSKSSNKKRKSKSKKAIYIYICIIVVVSIGLSTWTMSCLNDIFAFNKDDEVVTITIPKDATTGKIIGILHENKLIKNSLFCRFYMNTTLGMRDVTPKYLAGVYYIKPNMGVENMLLEFQETKEAKTVSISFPEGWTVDKMAEQLMKNGVCTEKEFYDNLDEAMFDYGFVNDVKDKKDRYHNLEGYLFPDTYEFFVGENPSSVINRMLKRFDEEWTDEYDARAKELGMTVDEVITLASIIQKEAGTIDQMKYISSVFHNRLNNPSNYPSLQSDATAAYVTNCVRYGIESSEYDSYLFRYNTYNLKGLPVGAICNPGSKAIEAALYPANTDYLYFCHNTETKELYLAKTLVEHNRNKIKAELPQAEEE